MLKHSKHPAGRLVDLPEDKGVPLRYCDVELAYQKRDGIYALCVITAGKSAGEKLRIPLTAKVVRHDEKIQYKVGHDWQEDNVVFYEVLDMA